MVTYELIDSVLGLLTQDIIANNFNSRIMRVAVAKAILTFIQQIRRWCSIYFQRIRQFDLTFQQNKTYCTRFIFIHFIPIINLSKKVENNILNMHS